MRKPTVSVCIGALNEGPDLEATVALLAAGRVPPDEIIVCDDGSKVPIGDRLKWCPLAKVIRASQRLGSGPAKALACSKATGDLIIVLDSHMRPMHDWLDSWLTDQLYNPIAVMSCHSTGFATGDKFQGYGADLKWTGSGFWEPKWTPKKPIDDPYRVHSVIGGAYLIPRPILEAVGGYAPCFRGYGCEEEFLSIRAWMLGYEVRVAPGPLIPHHYGRKVDRETVGGTGEMAWEVPFNRHVMAMVLFEDGVYEKHYRDKIPKPDGAMKMLDQDKEQIAALRKYLQTRRLRSDAQLHSVCGIKHP